MLMLCPPMLRNVRSKHLLFHTTLKMSTFFGNVKGKKDMSLDIVHPCTDYGFKRVFHNQQVVCGFLNSVLELSEQNSIKSVTFLDKELPSSEALGRDYIVDMLCESAGGRRFLIEMQNDFRVNYATKAFTEFCRLIAYWDADTIHQVVTEEFREQFKANETYDGTKEYWKDIKTAITLVITNKQFPNSEKKLFPHHNFMEPDVINTYRMTHERYPDLALGDLDARVVLVMLGNFQKTESELSSTLDRWLYAFKDEVLAKGVSRIPAYKHIESLRAVVGDGDKGLAEFYHVLNKEVVRNSGDLEKFEKNIAEVNMSLEDMKLKQRNEGREEGVQEGLQKGRKEGLQEGRKEGLQEGKKENAQKMLSKGYSVQDISEITGLHHIDIELLRDKILPDSALE